MIHLKFQDHLKLLVRLKEDIDDALNHSLNLKLLGILELDHGILAQLG